jgi:hypothetical protein
MPCVGTTVGDSWCPCKNTVIKTARYTSEYPCFSYVEMPLLRVYWLLVFARYMQWSALDVRVGGAKHGNTNRRANSCVVLDVHMNMCMLFKALKASIR